MYLKLILVSLLTSKCVSFMATPSRGFVRNGVHLFSSQVSADDIESMRAGEIKKELESYGISTRSFLEKKELVEALTKARADGLKPKTSQSPSTSSKSSASGSSTKESDESSSKESNKSREERLEEQMEKCKAMKAGDLKKELEARGISTKSFFEKPEFVKALAEAIVDGVEKGSSGGNDDTEGYAEYTNVEVLTDDSSGPKKKKNRDGAQQQGSPFGGGGNPFGGGMPGGMPGGMGGMGGIADMLKNMGMGGGAPGGSSPFGGGGGNPFGGAGGGNPFGGDMMGKAQKMMQNPKVMELMAKAQSNPKMMKAMQECMSNPAAFAKYQNDPEVSELIKELQKYI